MKQLTLALALQDRAIFDNFLPGANAPLLQELRARAEGRARTWSAAWLSGPSGAGKSHLLQAACAVAAARVPVAYLPLRLLAGHGAESLAGWQGAGLLAVDDVERAAGIDAWERALFALYREAEERGAVLLLAAEHAPQHYAWRLADLRSRLAASSLLSLEPLTDADAQTALRRRAQARGLELPAQSARFLQRHFRRDWSTLVQMLDTVDAAALEAQRRLTIPFIRQVLGLRAPP